MLTCRGWSRTQRAFSLLAEPTRLDFNTRIETSLMVTGLTDGTLSCHIENREVPDDNQTSSHLLGQNQQHEIAGAPFGHNCGEYCRESIPPADAANDCK